MLYRSRKTNRVVVSLRRETPRHRSTGSSRPLMAAVRMVWFAGGDGSYQR
jgi:hypothetical protein